MIHVSQYLNDSSVRDPGLQDVRLLNVSFDDEIPELVLNQTDQVEFAVRGRPLYLRES
jgi:hypothetical protein